MEFTNDFVVPTDVETAWTVLTDVPRIAPCLPGATVQPNGDNAYTGTVSVKVGPIKASYSGTAAFRQLDPGDHRMILDAQGSEKTGKGSAAAVVTVALHNEGSSKTRIDVHTDLQITGKLAQFGRSAMADVGASLIGQFATNLESLLATDDSVPKPATVSQRIPHDSSAPAPAKEAAANNPQATTTDLDLLTLAVPVFKRAVPAISAFTLGSLLTWLVSRTGTARAAARHAAQHGYASS